MKKKGLILFLIVLTVGFGFHKARNPVILLDLALANINALADPESGGDFKKGYEASSYQVYIAYIQKWTTIPCCKSNGNPYSGCSVIDICP